MQYSAELLEICGRHTRSGEDNVVVPEAYLPYIPPNWNRTLVLAEAQNLSKTNDEYVRDLKSRDAVGRMTRLRDGTDVGVQPWDNGPLKLAVEAALCVDSRETAVSNAVPWSRCSAEGANANPSPEMTSWAGAFWRDVLPMIAPAQIITAGSVAREVLDLADPSKTYRRISLRNPSPRALSPVSGMFQRDDLLARYPEVCRVVKRHSEWESANNVFFACHAVSVAGAARMPIRLGDAVDALHAAEHEV